MLWPDLKQTAHAWKTCECCWINSILQSVLHSDVKDYLPGITLDSKCWHTRLHNQPLAKVCFCLMIWIIKRKIKICFYRAVRSYLLSFSPHTWTSLFHLQTLTALTLTINIWFCQSHLTSYGGRWGSIGGKLGEHSEWDQTERGPVSGEWQRVCNDARLCSLCV